MTERGRHTRGLGERSSLRSDTSVTANGLQIKHSDNGDIQGLYDPASGKSYLIASNLSKDTAKGVFLHEVGVHMAADGSGRAAMEPLIARAAQIVINGASNGDATAKAVLQRIFWDLSGCF